MKGLTIIVVVLVLAAVVAEAEPRWVNPYLDSLTRSRRAINPFLDSIGKRSVNYQRGPEGEVRTRRLFDSHADDAFMDRDGLENGDTKY